MSQNRLGLNDKTNDMHTYLSAVYSSLLPSKFPLGSPFFSEHVCISASTLIKFFFPIKQCILKLAEWNIRKIDVAVPTTTTSHKKQPFQSWQRMHSIKIR